MSGVLFTEMGNKINFFGGKSDSCNRPLDKDLEFKGEVGTGESYLGAIRCTDDIAGTVEREGGKRRPCIIPTLGGRRNGLGAPKRGKGATTPPLSTGQLHIEK